MYWFLFLLGDQYSCAEKWTDKTWSTGEFFFCQREQVDDFNLHCVLFQVGFLFKQYDDSFNNNVEEQKIDEKKKDDEVSHLQLRKLELSDVSNDIAEIPTNNDRPWYMKDGQIRPQHSKLDPDTGDRDAKIFPEEKQGDRLVDQLMYVPPEGFIAEDQDDPDIPLKKILFWNGASSWGIRPGRGVFLKEKCPVSSCVIATQRKESSTADLIVFKDHFTMPGIERKSEQLWMIFMLGM